MGSTLLQRAIPFFLLPVFTRYLDPAEYGVVSIFQSVLAIAMPFLGLTLTVAIAREFHKSTKQQIGELVSNLLAIAVGMAVVVGAAVSGLWWWRGSVVGIPVWWFLIAVAVAPLVIAGRLNLTLLRFHGRPVWFGSVQMLGVVLNAGVSLLLVVWIGMGWEGRVTGVLLGTVAVGCVGLVGLVVGGYWRPKVEWARVKGIVLLAAPVSLHFVSSAFMTGVDRIFVVEMVGEEAVGVYAVAGYYAMILYFVLEAFHQAWGPKMYGALADGSAATKHQIVRWTYRYEVGVVVFASMVALSSYVMVPILTPSAYHLSTSYIPWIAGAFAVNGFYTMRAYYLVHTGRTGFLGVLAVVVVVVNVVCNYYLIGRNGAVGAAQATLIAYCVRYGCIWLYVRRFYPMPWRFAGGGG